MKFSNFTKVSLIDIETLPKSPVVYRWWFPKEHLRLVTNPYVNVTSLDKRVIGDKEYFALYVGIGVSCKERFNWHIHQKHSDSSVRSGYLSTLRQTISALLGKNMTESKESVDDILKECYLEWEIFPSYCKKELEAEESGLIGKGYYPLNVQKNTPVDLKWRQHLSAKRKEHRK